MGISGNFTMLWFHNAHFVPVAGSVRNGLAGGARGIGEIGITGMPAAIANAVFQRHRKENLPVPHST
jgi:CO/xanthine dehydrogenase Mo-binding subunit